jgi:hypothetical protein
MVDIGADSQFRAAQSKHVGPFEVGRATAAPGPHRLKRAIGFAAYAVASPAMVEPAWRYTAAKRPRAVRLKSNVNAGSEPKRLDDNSVAESAPGRSRSVRSPAGFAVWAETRAEMPRTNISEKTPAANEVIAMPHKLLRDDGPAHWRGGVAPEIVKV